MTTRKKIKKRELNKKLLRTMLTYLVIFGIPAVAGAFLGNLIDNTFDIKPVGTVLLLLIAYIISWVVAYRTYSFIEKKNKLDIKKEKDDE
jgi:F0F1-type ATP synthase assembly protein I